MLLYIDPSTGSMLFAVLLAIISSIFYLFRDLKIKIKTLLHGGRGRSADDEKIPIAIYSDHKRYWNVFEPICEELEKRGQKVVYLTQSPDDPALQKKYQNVQCEFIGEGGKAFAKLNYLNARILLSTTPGLEVYQWKRSKNVDWYVHIPHAASDITIYRMFGIDYYDAVLLSGGYQMEQVRTLEKLRNLPQKELQIVGIPYMDEMKKRLEAAGKMTDNGQRTVLLAPSWGKSGILSKYGDKLIENLLKTGYHIVIRPHPQSFASEKEMIERLMEHFPENDQLEWNKDNNNFEVLRRSDIMISDFSGVIFDFALVYDKPVIYADTNFDKAPYDACWIDEELWTFQILPQIGMQLSEDNISSIKEVIDSCMEDPKFASARDKARKETWMKQGEGRRETAQYLMNKLNELTLSMDV